VAVAVATLWLLSVGGEAEETIPVGTLPPLPAQCWPSHRPRRATRLRLVSVFRHGWVLIVVALLNQQRLPLGRFVPEPWPRAAVAKTQRKVIGCDFSVMFSQAAYRSTFFQKQSQ
jgi:hypothetical protein